MSEPMTDRRRAEIEVHLSMIDAGIRQPSSVTVTAMRDLLAEVDRLGVHARRLCAAEVAVNDAAWKLGEKFRAEDDQAERDAFKDARAEFRHAKAALITAAMGRTP